MPDGNTAGISTAAPVEKRASVGEIAAFVAEGNRLVRQRVSVRDRLAYFEWKADLFARLTADAADESVTTARAEVARLKRELAAERTGGPAPGQGSGVNTGSGRGAA